MDNFIRENHANQLKTFFMRSKLDIRWKKSWWKDWISPAMPVKEFLMEFDRQKTKLYMSEFLIKKKWITRENGMKSSVIVFTEQLLPQKTKFKSVCTKIHNFLFRPAYLSVLAFAFIFLAPHSHAFTKKQAREIAFEKRPMGEFGFFDPNGGVRCYWLEWKDNIALSCVASPRRLPSSVKAL